MPGTSPLTPDDYRKRYFELMERAKDNSASRPKRIPAGNPSVLSAETVLSEETIPGGWYCTLILKRGDHLRLVAPEDTGGVSAFFWNAHDTSERYNAADTVKVQWTARLERGRLLFSDMGRVLLSITDDTCGFHDTLLGGSTASSTHPRNTRDNFLLAAGKHGMGERDIGPCITFFAPVGTDADGRFHWRHDVATGGTYVDLRAEMDVIVALSNCPHPFAPERDEPVPDVRTVRWRGAAPGSDDFCRTASEEAVRAFENTESFLDMRKARP